MEGFDAQAVALRDIACALNFIVEDGEHTPPPSVWASGDADGVEEIEVSIGAHSRRRAHRPGHHDRFGRFDGKVQEIRCFFECGGAMRDHDT